MRSLPGNKLIPTKKIMRGVFENQFPYVYALSLTVRSSCYVQYVLLVSCPWQYQRARSEKAIREANGYSCDVEVSASFNSEFQAHLFLLPAGTSSRQNFLKWASCPTECMGNRSVSSIANVHAIHFLLMRTRLASALPYMAMHSIHIRQSPLEIIHTFRPTDSFQPLS